MTDIQHVPNEEFKPFMKLSEDEQVALIRASHKDGLIEGATLTRNGWAPMDLPTGPTTLWPDGVYRTTPKKLDLPWDYIDPKYKWAAMDQNGSVWLYEYAPKHDPDRTQGRHRWICCDAGVERVTCLTIDTDGIRWDTSRTQRPTT